MDDPPPFDMSPRHLPLPRVVIIGGGATGLLTSIQLAEAGYGVTVLEKKNLGNGSTNRSAACIRSQFSVRETALRTVVGDSVLRAVPQPPGGIRR